MPQYLHLALFCFILFCCLIYYSSFTWASCHFKPLATPPTACWTICSSVYQTKHQSSICITGPLCGESIDDWWIALTKGVSNAENVSISQCHHVLLESYDLFTVYPKKYAHGFCFAVLCCGYTLTDFPISTRLTSLALWQSNDCPSASKATLMNMDKYFMWIHYDWLHNHNKAKHNKTMCIFLGIYCTLLQDLFIDTARGYHMVTLVWRQ